MIKIPPPLIVLTLIISIYFSSKKIDLINIPRYIGFLEYLKIPEVTSLLTSSNWIGLTVVFDFMNCSTGFKKMSIPAESIKIDISSCNGMLIRSIFFDEK